MWVLIECGCAECNSAGGPYPLIDATIHPTEESAKKDAIDKDFKPHPQGGIIATGGQGASWIISLEDLAKVKELEFP